MSFRDLKRVREYQDVSPHIGSKATCLISYAGLQRWTSLYEMNDEENIKVMGKQLHPTDSMGCNHFSMDN